LAVISAADLLELLESRNLGHVDHRMNPNVIARNFNSRVVIDREVPQRMTGPVERSDSDKYRRQRDQNQSSTNGNVISRFHGLVFSIKLVLGSWAVLCFKTLSFTPGFSQVNWRHCGLANRLNGFL